MNRHTLSLSHSRWALAVLAAVLELVRADVPVGHREFHQRVWTLRDGLPHNRVQSLIQTQDGYLWIGTLAGLVRFDGVNFTVFNRSNQPAFVSQDCTALAEDSTGALWIGTANGLLRYQGGHFTRFTHEQGLSGDKILRLCGDRLGAVWVGTTRGLDRFHAGVFEVMETLPGVKESDKAILSVFTDRQGDVWASNSPATYRFNPATRKPEIQDFVFTGHRHSSAITEALDGTIWLASGVLVGWRGGRWKVQQYDARMDRDDRRCVIADRWGQLWFGTQQNGLVRFRDGKFSYYGRQEGLSDHAVLCLLEDREGSLWIGTETGGLNCWRPTAVRTLDGRDGLPHELVWSVCASRDESIWIGTEGGLSQFKEGLVKPFVHAERRRNIIRSLAEDNAGNLWIGTLGSGVECFRNDQFVQFQLPGSWEENKIRAVAVGKGGDLWIGALRGLYRLRQGTLRQIGGLSFTGTNEIRALHEDREGFLWAGTFGGGVVRVGIEPNRSDRGTPLRFEKTESDFADAIPRHDDSPALDSALTRFSTAVGLAHNNVWAIHEDAEGTLWIATEGGLSRIRQDRLTTFTRRQGLPDESINEIVEDDFGNLWLAGSQEIWRVSKNELNRVAEGANAAVQCVMLDEADGLAGQDFQGQSSQPSACKTPDGKLWFATNKGVVVVDPKGIREREIPPFVVIEHVLANNETVFKHKTGHTASPGIVRQDDMEPERQELAPGSGRALEFRYTACTFTVSEKARFKYRLEGFDKDWNDVGTRRQAIYTNLRPGSYRFRVLACNHNGVWNETGAGFAFSLAPYFWQTWWFHPSWIAAGALAGFALHRWRTREAARRQELEKQAALAEQRAVLGADLHDDAGASISHLIRLSDRGLAETKDHRFAAIATAAREALEAFDQTVWLLKPGNDTLDRLATRLVQTAEKLLDPTSIRRKWKVAADLPLFRIAAAAQRDTLLMTKESLHNVLKHSRASSVEVRIAVTDGILELVFKDDGCGFDSTRAADDRHGLASLRQRVVKWDGRLAVRSQPGEGTRIEIALPLKKISFDADDL